MRPIAKVGELARMRKRSVALILRVQIAVALAVSHRQVRDNHVYAPPIRPSDQIALGGFEYNEQIRKVWIGPVGATASVRLDLKVFRRECCKFGIGESLVEPD